MIKKILVSSLLLMIFSGCSTKEKLYIINWGEYMDKEIIKDFEKEFDVKVIYEEVDSNEAMYSRISSGVAPYDVAIPSDYLVEKMLKENMLAKIDYNVVDKEGIDQRYYDVQKFDVTDDYFMPYFYGSVGIMYHKDLVDEKDLVGWDVLWNEKYKGQIYMYDSMRETIGIGLMKNGFSLNSLNESELAIAKEDLISQRSILAGYGTDDIKYSIQAKSAAIGVVYSGDYLLLADDPNLGYYIPDSGTNVFVDNIVILKNGQNSVLANEFVNYISNYENNLRNSEYVGYSTVRKDVYEEFLRQDKSYYISDAYYVSDETFQNSEIYTDLGEHNKVYANLYTEIKLK